MNTKSDAICEAKDVLLGLAEYLRAVEQKSDLDVQDVSLSQIAALVNSTALQIDAIVESTLGSSTMNGPVQQNRIH